MINRLKSFLRLINGWQQGGDLLLEEINIFPMVSKTQWDHIYIIIYKLKMSKEEMNDDTDLKIQRYGIDKIKIMITLAFGIDYIRLKDVTIGL